MWVLFSLNYVLASRFLPPLLHDVAMPEKKTHTHNLAAQNTATTFLQVLVHVKNIKLPF